MSPKAGALASSAPRSRERRAEWATYLTSLVATVAALTVIMRLWLADLRVPFFYLGNDSTSIGAHFKTVLETGWYEYNPALGAPNGQEYHDFPQADNLHLIAARLLGWFTNDFAVALNVYYLIGFPLAALTAVYFLREVGVSRLLTAPLAALYALAPYHFLRNEGHLFLGSYYPLPLALVVVLRILRGQPIWGLRRLPDGRLDRLPDWLRSPVGAFLTTCTGRGGGTVLMLALLATASSYYAVFVTLLLAAAGLVALARTGNWRRFRGAVLAGLTIVVVVALNMLPDNLYEWMHGQNSSALSRDGAASEIYALKISSLLLPAPGHPIPIFSEFRYSYDGNYPVPSESPALGLMGAIGLLILLVMSVEFLGNAVRSRVPAEPTALRRARLRDLATLTMIALLCSTVGGLSTIISFFTPNIRGWNRMTILIAMFCLAALGVVLDAGIRRWERRRDRAERRTGIRRLPVFGVSVAALVLLVGVADQSLDGAIPPYADSAAGLSSDRDFVHAIEAAVPAGSMIFQLPFVPFPESPSVNGVADADQLKLYLSSTTLRWSGGGIRGRPQSDWPENVTSQHPDVMVTSLATIGFTGIVVDRKRTGDSTELVESGIRPYTGDPLLVSANGRYAFFSLAGPVAALATGTSPERIAANAAALLNPVMAYPAGDFNSFDRAEAGVSYKLWKSRRADGKVPIVNDREGAATVHLQMRVASLTGAPDVRVTAGDHTFDITLPVPPPTNVDTTDGAPAADDPSLFVQVDQEITVPPGSSTISLAPGPLTLALDTDADPDTNSVNARYAFSRLFLIDGQLLG